MLTNGQYCLVGNYIIIYAYMPLKTPYYHEYSACGGSIQSLQYLELFLGFFSLSVDFFLSFFSLGSLTFLSFGTFGIFLKKYM